MEKIIIKTVNGKVTITRDKNKATVVEERTCYGFKEKSVIEVTRVTNECMHFAFNDEKTLRDQFKNN